jgi:hypothetical protein
MSERGEHFLKSLAGSRATVVGHPVPVADMGRVMFLEDVFLDSETDIAFLNSFGMRAAFDGVDFVARPHFVRDLAGSGAVFRSSGDAAGSFSWSSARTMPFSFVRLGGQAASAAA